MSTIENLNLFIENLKVKLDPGVERFQELAGILKEHQSISEFYFIKITFDKRELLLDHEQIKNFKNSNNRYYRHGEKSNPPVKGHYHIISRKGKTELYSVNVDGTAHHRVNKGYQIPKGEADELRSLGVNISPDNIIQEIQSVNNSFLSFLQDNNQDLVSICLLIKNK